MGGIEQPLKRNQRKRSGKEDDKWESIYCVNFRRISCGAGVKEKEIILNCEKGETRIKRSTLVYPLQNLVLARHVQVINRCDLSAA